MGIINPQNALFAGDEVADLTITATSVFLFNPRDEQDAYVYFDQGANSGPDEIKYFFEATIDLSTSTATGVWVGGIGESDVLGSLATNNATKWGLRFGAGITGVGPVQNGFYLFADNNYEAVGGEVPTGGAATPAVTYFIEVTRSPTEISAVIRLGSHSDDIFGSATIGLITQKQFQYLYLTQAPGNPLAVGGYDNILFDNYSSVLPPDPGVSRYDILATIESYLQIDDPIQIITNEVDEFSVLWGQFPPDGGYAANPGSVYHAIGDGAGFNGGLYVKTENTGPSGWNKIVDTNNKEPFIARQSYRMDTETASSGVYVLDLMGRSGEQTIFLTGSLTSFTVINLPHGQYVAIEFIQDNVGGHSIGSWPGVGGISPTIDGTDLAGAATLGIIRGFYDGPRWI